MNYHPFGRSYFQLKSDQKIDFNPRVLKDQDTDSLKEVCSNIRG